MYVTRRLSEYKASPDAALEPPPPGPWSGYLVVQDEDYEAETRCCFGACVKPYLLKGLPIPHDRKVSVDYKDQRGTDFGLTYCNSAFFVPMPGQPLSAGKHYVVIGSGKHKGKVSTCSTTDDMANLCFSRRVRDVQPAVFDHTNMYQQVVVSPYYECRPCGKYLCWEEFGGKAVVPDAFPQRFLRRKGWKVRTWAKPTCPLGEAPGIIDSLRARTPEIATITGSGGASATPPVMVGKWYIPFLFVREGARPVKDQMKVSLFYEVALEQIWEVVFETEYGMVGGNAVAVNVEVQAQRALLAGSAPARLQDVEVSHGFRWFKPAQADGQGLGLSAMVVEQMKWEQERVGWVESEGRVKKTEIFDGVLNFWSKFRCCVLVERFVIKRLDGVVLLMWDFTHTNKTRCLWE